MRKIAQLPKPRNPFTPAVRRFLSDVFRPAATLPTLGKRIREDDHDENTQPAPQPQPPVAPAVPCKQPACVALQNEDADEDAIIITALNVIPFCCHADLVTMPRASLVAVARTLNAKLPAALQIDVGDARSDTAIRNAIELLVGLRHNSTVPPAPKANKLATVDAGRAPLSPSSPLAAKSRPSASLGSPGLAALREDDEHSGSSWEGRGQKRRRLMLQQADEILPLGTRSQSAGTEQDRTGSPSPAQRRRMLRARAERAQRKSAYGGHPSITVARGRYDTRAYARSDSTTLTSTPKRMWRESSVSSASGQAQVIMPVTVQHERTPTQPVRNSKRKAEQVSMDTSEMTFGIHGMTIAPAESSGSAMSIVMD